MTGRITIDLFTTLDLVAQAPGGPDEDPSNGFPYGGWQAPLSDDVEGANVQERLRDIDALVLGRRTYDIFADYWPRHPDAFAGGIAGAFNRIPKYVASRGTPTLAWVGSQRLGPDLAAEFAGLRERHENVRVIGSVDLVQTLLTDRLFDELTLWVYPVVLGQGKKVFPDGAAPANLRLIAPPLVSDRGAVLLRYAPAPGEPRTGTMGG
ncbi:dihydrofolate reductase family protein [Microbacterium hominis]|uniref:Dihydrofolate reductase family protein n=1 Tax=Microbacterium hominis TaxID=162426 RepID=A0A7D4Q9W9_9MICO|nr:dihydrofolate reductase family protein [Microbacterium hominis]QKJ20819.1 dihydrofolate reductase family protein [Microbacterium hominis]